MSERKKQENAIKKRARRGGATPTHRLQYSASWSVTSRKMLIPVRVYIYAETNYTTNEPKAKLYVRIPFFSHSSPFRFYPHGLKPCVSSRRPSRIHIEVENCRRATSNSPRLPRVSSLAERDWIKALDERSTGRAAQWGLVHSFQILMPRLFSSQVRHAWRDGVRRINCPR